MRVKFLKGKQREFMENVLENSGCPSLKELQNRIAGIKYASLKNYFSERRNLSKDLFEDLCRIANFSPEEFKIEFLEDSWGQSKGGKKSRRENGPTKNRT